MLLLLLLLLLLAATKKASPAASNANKPRNAFALVRRAATPPAGADVFSVLLHDWHAAEGKGNDVGRHWPVHVSVHLSTRSVRCVGTVHKFASFILKDEPYV